MTTDALRFLGFRGAKMPGFGAELKPDGEFGAQVTLVVGENASGKSSMARCLNAMIWNDKSSGILAEAKARIDQTQLTFAVDGPHHSLLGTDWDAFNKRLPNRQFGGNYYLSLDELIRGLDAHIAQTFLNELNGGLDPDEVRRTLGADDIKVSRSTSEAKTLDEAKRNLNRIQGEQANLAKRKNELLQLEAEKDASRRARKRIQYLRALRELRIAEGELEEQSERLKDFDSALDRLTKGDDDRLFEAMETLAAAASAREGEQSHLNHVTTKREELELPEGGVPEALVVELDAKMRNAAERVKEIEKDEREALRSHQEALDLLRTIDPHAKDEVLAKLPAGWADQNAALYGEYLQDFARKKAIDAELRLAVERSANTEGLKSSVVYLEAIRDLQAWLEADHMEVRDVRSKPAKTYLQVFIFALVALAVSGMQHLELFSWAVTVVLLVLTAAVMAWLGKSGPDLSRKEVAHVEERRAAIQANFQARKVTGSDLAWNIKGVSQQISDLYLLLEKSKQQEAAELDVRRLKGELVQLDERLVKHEGTQQALRDQLGTVVRLPESTGASSLYSYVDKVQQALRAFALTGGCEAAAEANRQKLKAELLELDGKCKEFLGRGAEELKLESILGLWKVLKEKARIHNDLSREEKDRKRALEVAEAHEKQAQERLAAICLKFGQDRPDVHRAKEMMVEWERYQATKQAVRDAEGAVSRLRKHPDISEADVSEQAKFEACTASDLELSIKESEVEADAFESVVARIKELEQTLERTAKGHDLERAMQASEEAYQNLMNLFQNNLLKRSFTVVLETLQQHRKSDDTSGLFSRADHYFRKFTHGKYRLDIQNTGGLSFSAWDVILERPVAFDHLSTGTQIQLRLAARMAVIEEREGDLKLPVFADELLANSDDLRAKAIIDALVEIARDGRQVFYFTAQGDEVAKWKESLEGSGLEWREVHMRSEGRQKLPTVGRINSLIEEPPSIDGHDRASYAKAIEVPAFDLLRDEAGALHIWYLTDDLHLLYSCLRRQLQTWGQLNHYYEAGGHLEGYTREHQSQFQGVSKVLRTALKLVRRGRSKPIDREVLVKSGAVSDTFVDRIVAMMQEHRFNPKALILALHKNRPNRFQTSKIDELETYFEEQGYLDNASPLSEEAFMAELAIKHGASPYWDEAVQLLNQIIPANWFDENSNHHED